MNRIIILLLLIIFACGNKQIHIYDKGGNLVEERKYLSKDTATYTQTLYYPSGQLKAKGEILNNERNTHWIEYYSDGNILWEGLYEEGHRVYPNDTITPIIEFVPEIANIGDTIKILIKNLHQKDVLLSTASYGLQKIEDKPAFWIVKDTGTLYFGVLCYKLWNKQKMIIEYQNRAPMEVNAKLIDIEQPILKKIHITN